MNVLRVAVMAALLCAGVARAEAPVEGGYVPGMGEIMGATQMRHAKLWYAGRAGNWALARYELGEIREGLDDAVKYHPVFKGAPVSALLDKYTAGPLDGIARAVDQGDRKAFAAAFDRLSTACNGCHEAAGHGYIVIKRPGAAQYSNQEFSVTRE